jgi:hypothetical protein
MLATVSFAQQQIATLNHNDSVSVFYGTTALQQAYDSAVNGDVILLSSGAFNQISIEKSITIRGNGIIRDTIADAEPTIINGCSLGGGVDNPVSNIVIEGVKFASTTYFYYLANPTFRKCMFDLVYANQANLQNGVFVNSIIHQYNCIRNYNTQFVNSTVNFYMWSNSNGCSMINCVAYLTPSVLAQSQQNIPDLTCTNSVLIAPLSYINAVNPLATFNCIGIKSNGYFENSASGNHNFSSLSSVFKDFSGLQNSKFIETEFELQDSIATNILGSDGTQIGVYGGMAPFTPRVTTPRYVRCNVAPHTNSDGKLSVDVEVVSE